MSDFKFELDSRVKITESGEEGVVKGRAEYTSSEAAYYIHYKAGDGRAVCAWWGESVLESA